MVYKVLLIKYKLLLICINIWCTEPLYSYGWPTGTESTFDSWMVLNVLE
jgi:hypothetical protein